MNRFRSFCILCLVVLSAASLCAQDSLNVSRIGQWNYWDQAMQLAIFSHYAYVATNYTGVRIVDIQYPGHPEEVGSIPNYCSGQGIMDIDVWQNYLIIAAGDSGLRVLSLTDPVHPVEVDRCDTLGTILYVDVSPDYVFALEPGAGTHVFFINPLQQLVWQGYLETSCRYPTHVATYGNYACISDICGNVEIFDIFNPTYAVHLGTWQMGGVSWDIAVSGHYLYAAVVEIGLVVADLVNPRLPQTVSRSDTFNATAIHITGSTALVGKYNHGLGVYNISNPLQPSEVVTYDLPGVVSDIGFAIQLAFVANSDWGLRVVDVFETTQDGEIGSYDTPHNYENKLYVEGNRLYMPDGGDGLWIIDAADPAHPEPIVFDTSLTNIYDLAFFDQQYACTADRSGLRILYVGIPTLITTIGSFPLNHARTLTLIEPYCYVACDSLGVYAFNLTNPLQPQNIGFCPAPISVRKLRGEGNTLCLLGEDTLITIDVTDPTHPTVAGGFSTNGFFADLYVWNHHACIAGWTGWTPNITGGFRIISIANPAQPFEEGSFINPGAMWTMTGQNEWIYLMETGSGLRVINISSPAQPHETGFYYSEPNYCQLAARGRYVYGNGYGGFQVFDCNPALPVISSETVLPARLELHPCYPNPFNAATMISYSLPVTSRVRLSVFDVLGRQVATPVDGVQTAGEQRVFFDGGALASGIYFARLEANGMKADQKMVLLK
ncbi:T9SS C-terminal target domain-containing protein [candidate division KSB1 bacterium]|nr:MAG: T9SS C-terminal target domain-containing protein [candidate division KSB1 bacterium]